MGTRRIPLMCAMAAAWLGSMAAVGAQDVPAPYRQVLAVLGRPGDFKDGVLKVNIPRTDLRVTVAGIETPTPFGFSGWIGMTEGSGNMDVMMGDLVLLEDEVNPVLSALLDHGLEVTALHNHFFRDEPRVVYLHLHGRGTPGDLARQVKPALDLIGRRITSTDRAQGKPVSTSGTAAAGPALSTARLAQIVGHQGEQTGSVYKITVGRDDLKVMDMGAVISARMGLNTWAAFVGTDAKAAVAGDVAMLEREVTPVLRALRQHGLDVVAIHHHMLRDDSTQTAGQPIVIFLHYWGTGPAEQLAAGFRAALDQLGRTPAAAPHDGTDRP